MLEIGTKVFINYVLNRHRPSPTGYEKTSEGCYGTVKSIIDDEYYEVNIISNVTGETLSGSSAVPKYKEELGIIS